MQAASQEAAFFMHTEIQKIFEEIGGAFVSSPSDIQSKLSQIKAFVYDWDGVFNNAIKNENKSSTFNEADSMGTNLLRYTYYHQHGEMPKAALISGERNEMAFHFSLREHFDASYYKIPHKINALNHFCEKHNLGLHEVCYFFDDVLDLSIAEACGLRILINRKANPLFRRYVVGNNLADYITGHDSGNFAIREASEMLIGLSGLYDTIITERRTFSENYSAYFKARQAASTDFYTIKDGNIILHA